MHTDYQILFNTISSALIIVLLIIVFIQCCLLRNQRVVHSKEKCDIHKAYAESKELKIDAGTKDGRI